MPDLVWDAKWISLSADPREDIGVFGFRRRFELEKVPKEFLVRVSADQRYKLFVNGEFVGLGPQRGDLQHWFYETYDLAAFLKKGENWIAALVWNFGRWAPMAQISARTGFVLEGRRSRDEGRSGDGSQKLESTLDLRPSTLISTPDAWQVARLPGWDFAMMHSHHMDWYIDVGPGEIIDAREFPWGWDIGQDIPGAAEWKEPNVVCQAEERGASGGGTPWMLVPRSIPGMTHSGSHIAPKIRRGFVGEVNSCVSTDDGSVAPFPLRIETGQKLLLDYGELLCAYPRLELSGPPGSSLNLTYAEALWQTDGNKGNRSEVAGKEMRGYQDQFVVDESSQVFEPLWWRTYRYLLIENLGMREPARALNPKSKDKKSADRFAHSQITLHSVEAIASGYPLNVESSFKASNPSVEKIWDVAVRTAERCAGETYFDCPYYEQLQYVGDTRIQALIGYYLARDRALQRNAVETLGWSLMENGLTQSRYPSRQTQVIPPFSLWWVMMVYDQMLYSRTKDQWRAEADQVLEAWTENFHGERFWNFADWVPSWRWGVPPSDHASAIHYLVYSMCALADQVVLAMAHLPDTSDWYLADQAKYIEAFRKTDGLVQIDDRPIEVSEHAEALYRICHAMIELPPDPWPTAALERASAAKCTYYFSYYKHLAMFGREDAPFDYMTELQPWKEMIENGLTTFAETPEPTRSDCHAWSAHPILGFFQIVAGVTSVAPGWKKARIMPHPGSLERFDARIAHPDGELRVKFENGKLEIDSPIPFELRWKGKKQDFKAGKAKA